MLPSRWRRICPGWLAKEYERPFLLELIAQKRQEKGPAPDLRWPFHDNQLRELETLLDRAYQASSLPEERDRQAVRRFLVHCRLGHVPVVQGSAAARGGE
jgi:hypothetical protein